MNYLLVVIAALLVSLGVLGIWQDWPPTLDRHIVDLSARGICEEVFHGRWMTAKRMEPFCLGGPVGLGKSN